MSAAAVLAPDALQGVEVDRRSYLGSSDIAGILGLSPFEGHTPVGVYLAKTIGRSPLDEKTERFLRNRKRQEPIVLDILRDEYGLHASAVNHRYTDPEFPFLAAEIDFEFAVTPELQSTFPVLQQLPVGTLVNGEIKTVHPFAAHEWGEMETDEIPIHYAAQAAFGQGVTGRRLTMFAVMVGADGVTPYWFWRDDETVDGIRQKAVEFWANVQRGVPPEPVQIEDVYRLFPKNKETYIEATPEVAKLVLDYLHIKEAARHAEEQADEIKYQIGCFALGAEIMVAPQRGPKHVVTINGQPALQFLFVEQTRIDPDILRKRHPAVALECSKTSAGYQCRRAGKK